MEQETEQEHPLTKNERRKLKKHEKQAHKASLKRKKQLKTYLSYIAVFAAAIGIIWGGVRLAQRSEASKPGEKVSTQGNKHIELEDEHVSYNTTPPTSGPHAGTARWGIHNEQIPDENQIHNLEDGGVGIQYDCNKEDDACKQLVDDLNALMKKYSSRVFLAPYSGIGSRIALTAWQRIDKFDEFNEQRVIDFIEEYRGIDHHPTVGR